MSPHEVELVDRRRLEFWIAPKLAIRRHIVDTAHSAPIAWIFRIRIETEVEHVVLVDIPHSIE